MINQIRKEHLDNIRRLIGRREIDVQLRSGKIFPIKKIEDESYRSKRHLINLQVSESV